MSLKPTYEELEQKIKKLAQNTYEHDINKVLKKLALGGTLEQILNMILQIAEAHFEGMIASILVVDNSRQRLFQAVPSKLPPFFREKIEGTPVRDGMGSCGTAAFRRERVVAEDLQSHPYWERVKQLTQRANLRACWSQPIIISNGEVVGTFALYYNEPKKPGRDEIKLLETMAQLASIAFENQRINKEANLLRTMLGNIIDSMPSVLVAVDSNGIITQWNKEAEKKTGIGPQKAKNEKLSSICSYLGPDILEKVNASIDQKKVKSVLRKRRHLNDQVIHEDITVYPLSSDGAMGAVIRIDDVSDRVRQEELMVQTEKLSSIGVLAGGIAHDFNNLLMGIQGRASLAEIELDTHHQCMEHIHAIMEYTRSASHLTKQLLGVAKGGKYEVKPADLNEIVSTGAAMFGRTKKEIRINAKLNDPSPIVLVDRLQIEQALLNLYVNAWQAMPQGGNLYLETAIVDLDAAYCAPFAAKPGRYAKIVVTDTGIGMDSSILPRIYDPFFTTKRKARGTGLGLASTYGIIENHKGIITVYSEVGHGTTFNIYLPLSAQRIADEDQQQPRLVKGSETVLLVDDEDIITDVGQAMLRKLGYRVIVANSGDAAIRKIQEAVNRVDLVILDLIMPEMDGGETFDRIRKINPDIPVILSSGYSINGQATSILNRGCEGFIQKPFNLSELSLKLRQVLNKTKDPSE